MNDSTALQTPHAQDGHEHSDISAGGTLLFIGSLAMFIVIVTGLVWFLYHYFSVERAEINQPRFPLAAADRERPLLDRLPPPPRLEGLDPESAIRSGVVGWPSLAPAQRERDQQAISSYGWVNAKAGIAQIPIDRAIELLADKLPVRKEEGKPATSPLSNGKNGPGSQGEKP